MATRAGAGRVVAAAVVVFLLAIVVGRFLLVGTWGWVAAALVSPVVVLVLAAILGWRLALLGYLFFVSSVLTVRYLVVENPMGWLALLLLPVTLLAVVLAARVARAMRA